jgi:hypothetical protein
MTEYFIRNITPRKFQIAKFTDGSKEPTEIYNVTENLANNYFHCDCMGFRRAPSQEHKHVIMAIALAEEGCNHFDENLKGYKAFNV